MLGPSTCSHSYSITENFLQENVDDPVITDPQGAEPDPRIHCHDHLEESGAQDLVGASRQFNQLEEPEIPLADQFCQGAGIFNGNAFSGTLPALSSNQPDASIIGGGQTYETIHNDHVSDISQFLEMM